MLWAILIVLIIMTLIMLFGPDVVIGLLACGALLLILAAVVGFILISAHA